MLKKIGKYILKIAIAGCLAIAILSILNIPYLYTGIHIDNDKGATDYMWEPNQLKTSMTEGFAWLIMDENGYNNSPEHFSKAEKDGVDILLMGSSHMEAAEVAQNENLGYLLNEKLNEKVTYNIGISGHDIYRTVDNAADAVQVYAPREFVIIETSRVALDEESMQEVISGTAKQIPSHDSGLIYYMQKIPAVKWLYKSLDDWMNQSKSAFINDEEEDVFKVSVGYKENLKDFLNICAQACKANDCTPVIFYHPQAVIEEDGKVDFPTEQEYLSLFSEVCQEEGIVFVDLTEAFYENYEENLTLPHGFINSYVESGHLNKRGHEIIADKLVEVLQQCSEEI